jgi:uncharacterized protein (DUF2147 family)
VFALALPRPLLAATDVTADIVGVWETIDDETRLPTALVLIGESRGVYTGRVLQVLDRNAPVLCGKCPGERHDRPILGMTILTRLRRQGEKFAGGDILDPDSGEIYRTEARLAEGGAKLLLRGYIAVPLLGRTQVWERQSVARIMPPPAARR